MNKIKFRILIANQATLAAGMASAMQSGKSTTYLNLMIEDEHYQSFDVPSDIASMQQVTHNYGKNPLPSGYGFRPLTTGDVVLDSNGVALVIAGEGDYNDVTAKFKGYENLFPKADNATPTASVQMDEAEEDEAPDEDDEDDGSCGACEVKPTQANNRGGIRVGAISNPRNVERSEMQGLIQQAIGTMFQAQNIPLTKDHSRRAVRALFRAGLRMAFEAESNSGSNKDPVRLVQKFMECMQKEAADMGQKMKAGKIAMLSFDE